MIQASKKTPVFKPSKHGLTINQLFDKWGFQHSVLAAKIKMLRPTFSNKMNPNHTTTFTLGEKDRLINALRLMEKDLHDIVLDNFLTDQEKESICPSCGYENPAIEGNEYKCPQCAETWLALFPKNKLF